MGAARWRRARVLEGWRAKVEVLKREVTAIAFAARDPRTPWAARLLVLGIVAYAVSPIDLIPDFIPVLGSSMSCCCCPSPCCWRCE